MRRTLAASLCVIFPLVVLLLTANPSLHAQTSSAVPLALAERPGGETVYGSVSDTAGGIWIVGSAANSIATSADAFQRNTAGYNDGFLAHIGADGALLYATYLGGTGVDQANAVARDAAGNIYVAGNTNSSDFPTTAGAHRTAAAGSGDAFVMKFDPTGKHLVYSTYLGGTKWDAAYGIAADANGVAYVVGTTQGFGFPRTWNQCVDATGSPAQNSFYTRLSSDGSSVTFSTCFSDSTGYGVTLDANGAAYVVGIAGKYFGPWFNSMKMFPSGAGNQGFLAKFTDSSTSPLSFSTMIGGSGTDWANGVAVTSKGIYIAGAGYSTDYPGAPVRQPVPDPNGTPAPDGTGWVMKVRLDGQVVLGTTLFDSDGRDDEALSLQVDGSEVVHVTGWTDSPRFPTTADAAQPASGGKVDAWYAKAWMPNNVVGDPSYVTYLGGDNIDRARSLALDGDGGAWLAGESSSTNFPSVNAKVNAASQAFVARFGQPRQSTSGGSGGDIVMYARDASPITGNWQLMSDSTAAAGTRIWNPDAGAAKISTPASTPANYFELTFTASAGVPYHLWLRMKADNDSWANDSVWVQFSDSVDSSGNPVWRTGTTGGTWVSLEDCSGCGEQGWGWNDNGYGTAGTPVRFASSGTHTIRIQQREDGISIDQIVLSSSTWASSAPGTNSNDTTIVPQGSSTPSNQPPIVSLTSPADGATYTQSSWMPVDATASDSDGTVAKVDFYANSTLVWTSPAVPYHFTWESMPAGTYTLTAVATDDHGATTTSKPVMVTVTPSGSGGLPPFFTDGDVGDVGAAGSASYSNGTFTVRGSGADVWGTADAFNFVSEDLAGDGAIVARVASLSSEANWVKAGVMMRGTLEPDSAQAFMLVSHAKGVCFQRRVSAGNTSASTCGSTSTAPRWVKLVRAGNVISGYESADGSTWTLVGSDTFSFPTRDVYAGLAVSSHVRGTLSTATFDHVFVMDDAPASSQCSSLTLSQTVFYSGGPASTWKIGVTAPTSTCTWTASIDQSWLALNGLTGPATITGTGSASVTLQTSDNRTGANRYGTFTIGGTAYRVSQEPY